MISLCNMLFPTKILKLGDMWKKLRSVGQNKIDFGSLWNKLDHVSWNQEEGLSFKESHA